MCGLCLMLPFDSIAVFLAEGAVNIKATNSSGTYTLSSARDGDDTQLAQTWKA